MNRRTVSKTAILESIQRLDLEADFDDDSRLEILTTSSGYESWAVFCPNGDEAIGLGGGKVHFRKREG